MLQVLIADASCAVVVPIDKSATSNCFRPESNHNRFSNTGFFTILFPDSKSPERSRDVMQSIWLALIVPSVNKKTIKIAEFNQADILPKATS